MIMKAGEPLLDVMTRERMSISDLMASETDWVAPEKAVGRVIEPFRKA